MTSASEYRLIEEFVDAELERGLLAALARDPAAYWLLVEDLSAGVFAAEPAAWRELAAAMLAERRPEVPETWEPTSEPEAAARRLRDLHQRRAIVGLVEEISAAAYAGTEEATAIALRLEERAARIAAALREADSDRFQWTSELLGTVLRDALERRRQREETGKPVIGAPTGIARLDEILGGLEPGLAILGGAPGAGKTTLAMQIAGAAAAAGHAVVYASFENSPANLALKALCARAGVNSRDVRRGYADMERLEEAARAWAPIAERIAIVEGSGALTAAHLRGMVLRAMNAHRASGAVLIVDYLQLMGKTSRELSGLGTVRERVETIGAQLRDVATSLRVPVLALASQNRAGGDYGSGKGKAALDSLKESGDLEFAADSVMFLTHDPERPAVEPMRAVTLTVAKNRNGETGTVPLLFHAAHGIIREEDLASRRAGL